MKTMTLTSICFAVALNLSAQAVTDFPNEVLGVKFGASKAEVQKAFPNGEFDKDGDYAVDDPAEQYSKVWFKMTPDGRFYSGVLVYSEDFLTKAGGGSVLDGFVALCGKIKAKYGRSDDANDNEGAGTITNPRIYTLSWEERKGVTMSIQSLLMGSKIIVKIEYENKKLAEEAKKKAAENTDFGF